MKKRKKKARNIKTEYLWLIAHVDGSLVHLIEKDLAKSNQYIGVEAIVPTLKILKKQFKGKESFQDVPLLFNYGFFKIPYTWAINPDLLMKVKEDITCISHWVQDKALGRPLARAAVVTEEQVYGMLKVAQEGSVHATADIEKLKVGEIITLLGYPFSGLDARIVEICKKTKSIEVEVKLSDELGINNDDWASTRTVRVSFDNVLYTIYNGAYDEDYNKEKTLTDYQNTKLAQDE